MTETYTEQMVLKYHPAALLHIDPHALKMYLVLANVARDGVVDNLSRPQIAALLGYTQRRTVDKHIRLLEKVGAIRVDRSVRADGARAVNRYIIGDLA